MSIRHDLLQLDLDDLATLSNRGNVKRAARELEDLGLSSEIEANEDGLLFRWSDGVTCVLHAEKTLAQGTCSCPANSICRHLVRSVLAYQRIYQQNKPLPPERVWDPGAIQDSELAASFKPAVLRRAKQLFAQGIVAELMVSGRPHARFHRLGHTVRFMIEGDVRYTQCDCHEPSPCVHAALAVLAFRAAEGSGIIDTTAPLDVPGALLDEAEAAVLQVCADGLANSTPERMARLAAIESRLDAHDLIWPSAILSNLREAHRFYHAHDARFSPERLAELVGEFLVRLDALRHPDLPIPQLFVSGSAEDIEPRLGQSRLVGLGCAATRRQGSVELSAILQDASSGKIMALTRVFADPDTGDLEDYAILANRLSVKGRSLAGIGRGQLVIQGAKLTAEHQIEIGRNTASVYAQKFAWEDLQPPSRVTGVDDIHARLSTLPPSSLRPRRVGEALFILPVAQITDARFDERDQAVTAKIVDHQGASAFLRHPYESRNRLGTERLLNGLTDRPQDVRFIAGKARTTAKGLELSPFGVVFETHESRTLMQPWVDDMDAHLEIARARVPLGSGSSDLAGGLVPFRSELATTAGELIVAGFSGVEDSRARLERLILAAETLELIGLSHFLRKFVGAAGVSDARDSFAKAMVWSRLAIEMST